MYLCVCFRKLLGQPIPYNFQTSTIVSKSNVHDTPHLWLCYWYESNTIVFILIINYAKFSLYLELVELPEVGEYCPSVEDAYEAAVHSVHCPTGIKLIWKA